MNFKRIGKIFEPQKFSLANGCKNFAQSPQTLIFDDFIRIYFSSREVDKVSKKHLSKICFVDFDLNFEKIININKNQVIELGSLGTYDEHGIFPLHILKDQEKIFGFIGGWNRKKSISIDGSIGISQSNDNGLTYKRLGDGPIMTSSINEPFLVGDPFVIKNNNLYYMFYIYGKKWLPKSENEPAARIYKIGYSTSLNLINWDLQNEIQTINDVLGDDECQALPTVLFHNATFHMIFCFRYATDFRINPKRGYKLGYATSKDLIEWERNDSKLKIDFEENQWDSNMQCYPHLVQVKNDIYLLYNGNEFGKHGFGIAKLINYEYHRKKNSLKSN